jgi:hypothetical protein
VPELHIERFLCDNCCFNCESYLLIVEFGILDNILITLEIQMKTVDSVVISNLGWPFFPLTYGILFHLAYCPFLVFVQNRVQHLLIGKWIYKLSAATPGFETSNQCCGSADPGISVSDFQDDN